MYLSFRSGCHRGAKVIQVPNVDFRLVASGRHQICLQTKTVKKHIQSQTVQYMMSNLIRVSHEQHQCNTNQLSHRPRRTYLEGVEVERSHWPCVLIALSDDDVIVPRHYFGWVVEDDISVLPARDQDPVGVTGPVHPMRAPHQFVISVQGESNTFTFRAFRRLFYPKQLTISTFVIRSATIHCYRYSKDVHRTKCKY